MAVPLIFCCLEFPHDRLCSDYPRGCRLRPLESGVDDAAALRRDAGEIEYRLLAFDDNANKVVHFSRWSSLAAARTFFESAELVEIRRQAGVRAPDFHYLTQIETGIL